MSIEGVIPKVIALGALLISIELQILRSLKTNSPHTGKIFPKAQCYKMFLGVLYTKVKA
jgi:hypothetical protein